MLGCHTCWQGGQNHSPSGIIIRGGRRQAVWYPLSQDAGACLSCPGSSMTRVGAPCGSDSWYSTPLLFWMLSLAGFSPPGIFHGSIPGLGLGDGTRVSGSGHSVKMWALPVLTAVPSRSQLSLVRSKLTSAPAHEVTKAER